jgi:hypothetical protein
MNSLPRISSAFLVLLAALSLGLSLSVTAAQPTLALSEALAKEDLSAVRLAVAAAREALGPKAGEPEVADTYLPIPKAGRWLTATEARRGFQPDFGRFEKLCWWRIGLDPMTVTQALRGPASFVGGNVAVARVKLDGADQSLAYAMAAGDFLLWAQAQAGSGVFPFPAARGGQGGKPFEVAERFLAKAEKEGHLKQFVHQGWVIDDATDGGLQFDNGECGVAMFELYELTREPKYLASGRQAADWAMTRQLVANWNYNSFSVYLLAKAYQVTAEERYLTAATKKAVIGVIPGQLTEGSRAGRWLDPHNARPAYHYIMLRGLAQLAAVMPKHDPARGQIMGALQLGLRARNQDFLSRGAPNKDKAMETLLLVNRTFADEPEFLRTALVNEALEALGKLVSEQARAGGHPLGFREWGLFLEAVARQSPSN